MNIQFEYLINLADKYKTYNDNHSKLYSDINEIGSVKLNEIYDEYGAKGLDFKPVNLLRAEVVKLLLEGNLLTPDIVDKIKENIRTKNTDAFGHYPKEYREQIKEYRIGKRDMFANWQKPWSIFHTFFYRGKTKETTQQYLEQICLQLKSDLELNDYTFHFVDFNGATHFGTYVAWLALYPEVKYSHRDAYQFFALFSKKPEAGRLAGHSIDKPKPNEILSVSNYSDIVRILKAQREDIVRINNQTRNYFKFAPGEQAMKWETFYTEGKARIGYDNLGVGDISEIKSHADLNIAAGLEKDSQSNQTWNLWLFKTANIGDLVFVNKGTNTCLGIGIIESDYHYDANAEGYNHFRKVKWIVNKVYQYKRNDIKNYSSLFRPDTFSPTKVWQFLLGEYVRLYPELLPVFEENNIKVNFDVEQPTAPIEEILEEEDEREIQFWWMNANPSIWSISSKKEGELQTYTARNERGNKRRIYKHFEAVQKGDIMIGYESSPVKLVKAIYEVTKGLHNSEKEGEVIEFQLVEKLDIPVSWNELNNNPSLSDCEVFINNQGSLFRLKEEEFDIIREIIDNKNIISEQQMETSNHKDYNYLSDPDKPFIEEENFKQIVRLLKRKKNIILQGPPGVGKTFIARKLAYEILGYENDAQITTVQFHQSFSYEDFIQGLRPGRNGFELKNGVFYAFCQKAHAHPDRAFFFVIDEINRGNLSKIFGELLMLIEADKRKNKFALKLTYGEEETDTFFVPENLHIIGTMNTADRSLAIVDYALRRRFAFINLVPCYDIKFGEFLLETGIPKDLADHLSNAVKEVNKEIAKDLNLGSGFEIGHSYFCTFKNGVDAKDWYNEVLDFEIKPLLEEIWFDSLDVAERMIDKLRFN